MEVQDAKHFSQRWLRWADVFLTLIVALMPTLEFEQKMGWQLQSWLIAGTDEAGRGALAGPVVAAAVILPLDQPQKLQKLADVNDSKQLSARQREELFGVIMENVLSYGVGEVPAQTIDQIGILPATYQAMHIAIAQLCPSPTGLLLDGNLRLPSYHLPQQPIIRGDSHSLTIAAASILAKVSRDLLMVQLHEQYPQYGFAQHKGYGTRQHKAALQRYGATPYHRHTFAPINQTPTKREAYETAHQLELPHPQSRLAR